ncbi:MAG TPA: hypothetical protein VF026_30305 [Ktedonobacteraceae bacterium]
MSYQGPPSQPLPPGQQPQWGQQSQPPGNSQYPQYQPLMYPMPKGPKRTWYQRLFAWCRRHPITTAIIIVVILVVGIISNVTSPQTTSSPSSTPAAQTQSTADTSQPTQPPAEQPTQVPQVAHYPPKTLADLHGLAAKGDASAIHAFHSESVGATGVCPQPKLEVTVDPSVTGQQLAEDLLAYFYGQHLDSPCGSLVGAYHNQSEAGNGYTAGRISFDVTDSSGQPNLDPNATNLKYTLTLDTGDVSTGQEYVVTY